MVDTYGQGRVHMHETMHGVTPSGSSDVLKQGQTVEENDWCSNVSLCLNKQGKSAPVLAIHPSGRGIAVLVKWLTQNVLATFQPLAP